MDITLLRILVIDESANKVEHLLNILRSAGLAVNGQQLTELDKLQHQLKHPWDLLIYSHSAALPIPTVLQAIQHADKDLPVLMLLGEAREQAERYFAEGVADIILENNTLHLVHSVNREYQHLQTRRQQRHLQKRLYQTEKRCQLLLDNARDPIAYLHHGMHI